MDFGTLDGYPHPQEQQPQQFSSYGPPGAPVQITPAQTQPIAYGMNYAVLLHFYGTHKTFTIGESTHTVTFAVNNNVSYIL